MTEFKPAGCVSELQHICMKKHQAQEEKSHWELTSLLKVKLSVQDSHSNLPRPDLQQLYISPLLPTKRALMDMFVVNGLKFAVPSMAETYSQGLRMPKNTYIKHSFRSHFAVQRQGHLGALLSYRVWDSTSNLCISASALSYSDPDSLYLVSMMTDKHSTKPTNAAKDDDQPNLQECRRRKNQTGAAKDCGLGGGHRQTQLMICICSLEISLQYVKAVFTTPPHDCHSDCVVSTSSRRESSCQDTQKQSFISFYTLCSFRIQLDFEASDDEVGTEAWLCIRLIQTNVCDLCWERAPLPL